MTINNRLESLRSTMQKRGLNAYIIPSNDIHQSEYVSDHWGSRQWISGFTGSAGLIVVTEKEAGLWTDSRYFLQGEMELADTEIKLHKPKNRFAPEHIEWLAENLPEGSVVGIDGDVCMIGQYENYSTILEKEGISFNTEHDLFDEVWTDRPAMPMGEIFEHDIKFAGKNRADKIADIRKEMSAQEVDHHLVTALDDIAWIFNIRGSDVEFNPLATAFAVISMEETTLFIEETKVPSELLEALSKDEIHIKPYDSIKDHLQSLSKDESILVDLSNCSVNLYKAIAATIVEGETISTLMKAIKNETELAHTRITMAKDGAAIANTFYWIEQQLKEGKEITEADVSDKLIENRSKMTNYVGESFPAIVGYKGNGAIIHYRPMHGSCATLKADGILLVDSGGQYLDGTTDITRTIALALPSKEEKRNFTLVLKGNISLSRVTFPKGIAGAQLDTLARMHLWEQGLDYGHGTGHGVGFFLNVHEGPQGITGLNSERGLTPLEIGMITSNEPGYYKEGKYGIRVENLVATVEAAHQGFLEFETLSLYPIDIKLIDEAIFTKTEKAWLNSYHHRTLREVEPFIEDDAVKAWFKLRCRPMN